MTGARVPDGRYTASLAGVRRCRQRRRPHLGRDRGHGGTRRGAESHPVHLLPERRRRRRHDRALAWSANEKATGTARIYRGTTLVRSWTITVLAQLVGGLERPQGVRGSGQRRQVHVQGRRSRTRPATVAPRPPRSSWTALPEPCAGRATSSRRTATRSGRHAAPDLAPDPIRHHDAAPLRRGRHARADRLDRRAQAAGTRSWTWNGRLADGTFAPQGRYTARLTVGPVSARRSWQRSVWAAGFAVTPSATTVVPGKTLTVRFGSDRAADESPDGHVHAARARPASRLPRRASPTAATEPSSR